MTPESSESQLDHFDATLARLAETAAVLRELAVPAELVHSLSVEFWSAGAAVSIHINGKDENAAALVDRIANHYGLPEADPYSANYARGQHLGVSPVHVYCGRPDTPES